MWRPAAAFLPDVLEAKNKKRSFSSRYISQPVYKLFLVCGSAAERRMKAHTV